MAILEYIVIIVHTITLLEANVDEILAVEMYVRNKEAFFLTNCS